MVTLLVQSGYETVVSAAVEMTRWMDMPLSVREPTSADMDDLHRKSMTPPVLIIKCYYVSVRTEDDVKKALGLYG